MTWRPSGFAPTPARYQAAAGQVPTQARYQAAVELARVEDRTRMLALSERLSGRPAVTITDQASYSEAVTRWDDTK